MTVGILTFHREVHKSPNAQYDIIFLAPSYFLIDGIETGKAEKLVFSGCESYCVIVCFICIHERLLKSLGGEESLLLQKRRRFIEKLLLEIT
jgi:hypothetical protein